MSKKAKQLNDKKKRQWTGEARGCVAWRNGEEGRDRLEGWKGGRGELVERSKDYMERGESKLEREEGNMERGDGKFVR